MYSWVLFCLWIWKIVKSLKHIAILALLPEWQRWNILFLVRDADFIFSMWYLVVFNDFYKCLIGDLLFYFKFRQIHSLQQQIIIDFSFRNTWTSILFSYTIWTKYVVLNIDSLSVPSQWLVQMIIIHKLINCWWESSDMSSSFWFISESFPDYVLYDCWM